MEGVILAPWENGPGPLLVPVSPQTMGVPQEKSGENVNVSRYCLFIAQATKFC